MSGYRLRLWVRELIRYPIVPIAAPRQNRASRFNPKLKRRIERYHAFRDEVRWRKVNIPPCCYVVFEMPVPRSARSRVGLPHEQTPDLDNLLKALWDACLRTDAHVHTVLARKVWALEGAIAVGELVIEIEEL